MKDFIGGVCFGVAWFLVLVSLVPTKTKMYIDGQQSIRKEAFDNGYMVKKIGSDDKIIYEWIEK